MYYLEIIIFTKEIKLLEEKLEFYKQKLSECFKGFLKNPKTEEFCKKNEKTNKNFSKIIKISENYHKIDEIYDNKNEKNKEIDKNVDKKNEKNKEIEKNDDNKNEKNIEIEKNDDNKNEENIEIEKNDDNKNEENKEINENEKNNLNYFQNKIKKKISLKTHPDLIKGKEIFFINALKYIEEDNIFGLIEICQILNIDISEDINKRIYKLIKEEKDKKKKKIESVIAWIWYEKNNLRTQIREIFSKQWNVSIEEIKKQEEEFEN